MTRNRDPFHNTKSPQRCLPSRALIRETRARLQMAPAPQEIQMPLIDVPADPVGRSTLTNRSSSKRPSRRVAQRISVMAHHLHHHS
jgi:hypothetical protein